MKKFAVIALFALSSCATYTAHEARTKLLGLNQNDLFACMGIPGERLKLDKHESIFTYDYVSNDSVFSLTLLTLGDVSLGARGECLAIFRMKDGVVSGIEYSRTTTSLYGSLGACGPILAPCLKHAQRTTPPPDYDPMAVFSSSAK